ncbi:transmembrane protein 141-like [Babylonia areolata]|uniref:transmembrane protein 141-like n=1 Tax=Babylonia areolata TaxID=304850 RepID=UPI003FD4629B
MTTRLERVTEEYKEKFPHMKQYAACQSKAFMTGCFTFLAGGASVYLAQELLRTSLPYGRKYFLLPPIAFGTISAYAMTRHNTRVCQDMWLAMEEKHSDVTPLQERLQLSAAADDTTASNTTSTKVSSS